MRIEDGVKLDFKDVLIRPKRSTLKSRREVDLTRTYKMLHSKHTVTGIPVTASNMSTTGTFGMAAALAQHGCFTTLHKYYEVSDWEAFAAEHASALPFVAVSSGISSSDQEKLGAILAAVPGVRMICLDVANGYSESFVECVRSTRERFPEHVIWAGNVVTSEMVEALLLAGADVVKVGIGPGSVCETRRVSGVGYPQLSAIIECADAAHGIGGLVCADGGVKTAGDLAKAFAAGADFVMLGGIFAGHDEGGGEVVEKDGKKFQLFYGMSSSTAMKKFAKDGAVAEYRASEGKTVLVEHKGPVAPTVLGLLGGVRSACTYTGAASLKELSKRTTFVRVSQQLNPTFAAHKDLGTHGYKLDDILSPGAAAGGGGEGGEGGGGGEA